jgi:hypothetical protein
MAEKSTKKPKPIIKPVSFSENNEVDLKIMKHIKDNNLAFSSYVKDLIISDMRKLEQKNEIAEAINNLACIISNSSFNIVQNNTETIQENEDTTSIDQEKKDIIGNILNMSK